MAHASGSGWNQFYHLAKLLDQGCMFKPKTDTQALDSREVKYPWGHLVWGCLMYFFRIAWGHIDFGRSYFPKMLIIYLPIPLALLIIWPWHPSPWMMEFISSPLWTLWLSQTTIWQKWWAVTSESSLQKCHVLLLCSLEILVLRTQLPCHMETREVLLGSKPTASTKLPAMWMSYLKVDLPGPTEVPSLMACRTAMGYFN